MRLWSPEQTQPPSAIRWRRPWLACGLHPYASACAFAAPRDQDAHAFLVPATGAHGSQRHGRDLPSALNALRECA